MIGEFIVDFEHYSSFLPIINCVLNARDIVDYHTNGIPHAVQRRYGTRALAMDAFNRAERENRVAVFVPSQE